LTTSTPDAGDGRTLIAFGDSFTCSGAGNGWYSYALFESRDTDPTDGLYVDGTVDGSRSGEFLPTSLKVRGVEYTKIPTSGIEVGGEQYVDFIPVKSWGQAGMWTTNYAQAVVSRAQVPDIYGAFMLPDHAPGPDGKLYFVATSWAGYNTMMRTDLTAVLG
jgi:hypothetical protein